MGRKAKWLTAVKKAFSPDSKEKKDKKKLVAVSTDPCAGSTSEPCNGLPFAPPSASAALEVTLPEIGSEHNGNMCFVQSVNPDESGIAPQEASEVVHLTNTKKRFPDKSVEEVAAIKIQTAFRGFQARKALRALRGLVRLNSVIHGDSAMRQATTTLRCMQTLARVQSQIHLRRIRMTEESHALQRQLQLKREQELEALKASMGEEWNDTLQTKEKIDANLLSKHEAAVRRERALAYAFSHQWKSSSRSVYPMFSDPNNPHWDWSWLERWMSAKPCESRSMAEREVSNDHASVKSASGGEILKAYARRDTKTEKPSPRAKKSCRPSVLPPSSTPPTKSSPVGGKPELANSVDRKRGPKRNDLRNPVNLHVEQNKEQSVPRSPFRDDVSVLSSSTVPNYMIPTKSARAKVQTLSTDSVEALDGGSVVSVKKRLSFPVSEKHAKAPSATPRRHSDPPKLDATPTRDIAIFSESTAVNVEVFIENKEPFGNDVDVHLEPSAVKD